MDFVFNSRIRRKYRSEWMKISRKKHWINSCFGWHTIAWQLSLNIQYSTFYEWHKKAKRFGIDLKFGMPVEHQQCHEICQEPSKSKVEQQYHWARSNRFKAIQLQIASKNGCEKPKAFSCSFWVIWLVQSMKNPINTFRQTVPMAKTITISIIIIGIKHRMQLNALR